MGQIEMPKEARPIRVCECIWDLSACGAQRVVKHLVQGMDYRRFQPIVYTFRSGPVAEEIRELGIVIRVFERGLPKLDPRLVLKIRKRLKQDAIDVLHTHLFGATLHGFLAAIGLRSVARVVTVHGDRADNVTQELAYPFLLSSASRVVAVSESVAGALMSRYRIKPARLQTILNGIDTEAFRSPGSRRSMRERLGLPLDGKVVGTIGRLTMQKGHGILLDAFARVRSAVKDCHLVVIGDGELRHKLVAQCASQGLTDAVAFLGWRSDVVDLLGAMDVFVLSSLWEGLPIVLLEAMAAGVPIVATDVGGVREVLRNGEHALIVAAGDSESLAHGLLRVLTDGSSEMMIRAARKRVEGEFGIDRMVHAYQEIYESLCTAAMPRRVFSRNGDPKGSRV